MTIGKRITNSLMAAVVATSFLSAGTAQGALPTANILAHYELNGDALDSAAVGPYNGTENGGVGYVIDTGRGKLVLDCQGVDDFINVAAIGTFNLNNSFTMSMWAKVPATVQPSSLLSTPDSTAFSSMINIQGSPEWNGVVGDIGFGGNGRGNTTAGEAGDYDDGTWHHIVVTYSGATAVTAIYVDGAVKPNTNGRTMPFRTPTPAGLRLGAGPSSNGGYYYLVGRISDVILYSTNLTASAVNDIYVATQDTDVTPPAAPTGLTATPGAGQVVLDWNDNTEPDLAWYNVYRGTATTGPYSLVESEVTGSGYTDVGLAAGTYFYVVRADDMSDNESGNSSEASATPLVDITAPAAPSNLTALEMTDKSIVLDWDDNSEVDLDSYSVYRSLTQGGSYEMVTNGLTDSVYVDTGLSAATPYYYVVTASDVVPNESVDSGEATDTTATTAAAGLVMWWPLEEGQGTNTIEGISDLPNVATLVEGPLWGAGIAPGSSNSVDFSDTPASSYIDGGTLKSDGTYVAGWVDASDNKTLANNYTVTAWINADTVSGDRTIVSGNWSADSHFGLLIKDGIFRLELGTSGYSTSIPAVIGQDYLVAVRIDNDAPFSGLKARVSVWDGSSWVQEDINGISTFELEGVNIGEFRAGTGTSNREFDGRIDDVRIYSNTLTQMELGTLAGDTTAPAVPQNLNAPRVSATAIQLVWQANSEADLASYSVYRSLTSGGGSGYVQVTSGLTENAFLDESVSPATVYYYVVTASDVNSNESGYSGEATASDVIDTTAPAAPTGLSAKALSHSSTVLSWDVNSESDVSHYIIKRSLVSGVSYVAIATNIGVNSITYYDTTMSPETQYYYVVTAVDYAALESAKSGQKIATSFATPDPDLVLWWNIEEGESEYTTEQVTGEPMVAQLIEPGSITWVDGIAPGSSKALLFTDTNPGSYVDAGSLWSSGYVSDPDGNGIYLNNTWTVTAWVELTDPQGDTGSRAVLSSDWGNSGGDFMLQLYGSDNHFRDEFGGNHTHTSTIGLTPGEVYLVAWVTDTTETVMGAGVKARQLVWDGEFWVNEDYTDGYSLQMDGLEIGSFSAGREFRGAIDDVRIYDRALTQEELNVLAEPNPVPTGTLIIIR